MEAIRELRLGGHIQFEKGNAKYLHPEMQIIYPNIQESLETLFERPTELPNVLLPGSRCLVSVAPKVTTPATVVGLMTLRSTYARVGLISPTAIIQPGWNGFLTGEIYNSSKYSMFLDVGDHLWNLCLVTPEGIIPEVFQSSRYMTNELEIVLPKAPEHTYKAVS